MPVDCSVTEIICGTAASCAALSSDPPSWRRCMLPQRSNRCRPTASSSSLLVVGDVHSRCSWRRRGNRRSRPASGATVALMLFGQLHHLSALYVPAILFFGLTCHVTRMLFCSTRPLLTPASPGTAAYAHALGLNAFALTSTGAC